MQQPKILVAIRKRPLNKKQQTRGDSDIISVKKMQTVIVSQYKQKVDLTKYLEETVFNFDFAYDQNKNNQDIYQSAVRPLVDSAFQGAKVTCFAYGQTGSGKTYTMNGVPSQGIPGLYTLAAQDLFAYLQDERFSHLKAKLCFFQIYCGKLFDLLNKRQQLKIREDNKSNINIIGLQQIEITSRQEFMDLLNYGASQRVTSQNSANLDSSRSHAILQIMIKDGKKIHGKMSFIDLAGNERGADHMDMSKQTRIDGAQINKSLLSLKECIRALDQGKGHTPFRGSKLTMVLKDSFIGFCRTVMIGNVSPSSTSSENTLNTLRYADRVKQLRRPSNSVALTKEQQKAKQMMLPRTNKNVLKIDINKDDDAQDIQLKRENAQRSYGIIENESSNNGNIVLGNKRFQNNQIQSQQPMQVKQPNLNNNNAARINMHNVNNNGINSGTNGINNLNNGNQMFSNGSNNFNYLKKNNDYQQQRGNQNQESEQQAPTTFNRIFSHDQYNNYRQQPQMIEGVPSTLFKGNSTNNQNFRGNQMEVQNGVVNYKNNQPQTNNFVRQSGNTNNTNQYANQIHNAKKNTMEVQSPLKFRTKNPTIQPTHTQINPSQNNSIYTQKNVPTSNNGNFSINFVSNPMPAKTFDIPSLFINKSSESQNTTNIPQDFQIPNNWQQAVDMIFSTEEPQRLLRLQQSISENLLIEQTNLIEKHSNTLRRQIDTIKQQMALISKLQMDRNAIETRDYVSFLQQSIEQKLSSLQLLRENLQQFTYKLDQVEQIQERVKSIVGQTNQGGWDDEQLLDDLH